MFTILVTTSGGGVGAIRGRVFPVWKQTHTTIRISLTFGVTTPPSFSSFDQLAIQISKSLTSENSPSNPRLAGVLERIRVRLLVGKANRVWNGETRARTRPRWSLTRRAGFCQANRGRALGVATSEQLPDWSKPRVICQLGPTRTTFWMRKIGRTFLSKGKRK